MANIASDVYGKKVYRAERDAKMYLQFAEKKMTIYEIATRWCVDWLIVKNALEREITRLGVVINLEDYTGIKRKKKV